MKHVMSLIDQLLQYLKKSPSPENAPEGYCPNCWGKQEYGGELFVAIKNHGLNANNMDAERGWIQDYAEKHLKDIAVHQHDGYNMCSKCKLKYKKED